MIFHIWNQPFELDRHSDDISVQYRLVWKTAAVGIKGFFAGLQLSLGFLVEISHSKHLTFTCHQHTNTYVIVIHTLQKNLE